MLGNTARWSYNLASLFGQLCAAGRRSDSVSLMQPVRSPSELPTNWHYFVCNLLIFKRVGFTTGLLDKGYICVAKQYGPACRGNGYKSEQRKKSVWLYN